MSLWQRFKRALRSIFGGWVSELEDPALILEQNIRDMRDKVPKMNENIAMLRANAKLVDKEKQKLEGEQAKLIANVKAAIGQNREDIAAEYALQLEHNKAQVAKLEQQLAQANAAAEKGEQAKVAFMKELDRKTKEALDAIETAKRAKWQKEVADTMEQFTAGGVDHTHDEMVSALKKKARWPRLNSIWRSAKVTKPKKRSKPTQKKFAQLNLSNNSRLKWVFQPAPRPNQRAVQPSSKPALRADFISHSGFRPE